MKVIDEPELETALMRHQDDGSELLAALVKDGIADENLIADALSRVSGLLRLRLATTLVDTTMRSVIPESYARSCKIAPLSFDRAAGVLSVAMVDPTQVASVEEIATKGGVKVEATVATLTEISQLWEHLYRGSELFRSPTPLPPIPSVVVGTPHESEDGIMHDMEALRDALHQTDRLGAVSLNAARDNGHGQRDSLMDSFVRANEELEILIDLCRDAGLIDAQRTLELKFALNDWRNAAHSRA